MRLAPACIAFALFALAPRARADDASGLSLAVRAGYGIPLGNLTGETGNAYSDSFNGLVPLGAEVLWRFDASWSAGVFFNFAPGLVANCLEGASCSGSDLAGGVQAIYRFAIGTTFEPWVGASAGFEHVSVSFSSGGSSVDGGGSGPQASALAGVDLLLGGGLRLAPTLTFTVGELTSVTRAGQAASGFQKSLHELLTLGLRLSIDL